MADESLVTMLQATDPYPVPKSESVRRRVHEWNQRRGEAFRTLEIADLVESWEYQPDLSNANLAGMKLSTIDLGRANLRDVKLPRAELQGANFRKANLSGANLRGANLFGANLSESDLSNADLGGVNLTRSLLVETDLSGANLCGAKIYGIAAWALKLEGAKQSDLIITDAHEPTVTVDSIEMAQFVYLLLENRRIRDVIDTITSKVVLILGRFTKKRKNVLDALRDELRKRDYTPVVFDFEKPESHNLTETVSTLAHMARFVIADITDAKSIPQELQKIVPNLPSLPVVPIILDGQYEYAMFKDFGGYLSVLPPYRYRDGDHLLGALQKNVIAPALGKVQEIKEKREAFERELTKR